VSFAAEMIRCDASVSDEERATATAEARCAASTNEDCGGHCGMMCTCPDDGSACGPSAVMPCFAFVDATQGLTIDVRDDDGNRIGGIQCILDPDKTVAESLERGSGDPCDDRCTPLRAGWVDACAADEIQAALPNHGLLKGYYDVAGMTTALCAGEIDQQTYNLMAMVMLMEAECVDRYTPDTCDGRCQEECACDADAGTCGANPDVLAMIEAELSGDEDNFEACIEVGLATGCADGDDLACRADSCDMDAFMSGLADLGDTCARIVPFIEDECAEPACTHADLAGMLDAAMAATNEDEQQGAVQGWLETLGEECSSCLFQEGQDFGEAMRDCVAEAEDGEWCNEASVNGFMSTGQCEVHEDLAAHNACASAALARVSDTCKACTMLAQDRVSEMCFGMSPPCESHTDCSPGGGIPAGCEPCPGAPQYTDKASCETDGYIWFETQPAASSAPSA
jgi:hypothetical protein